MSVWLYRSLGVAARINLTTSHIHFKGIPFNWIVAVGMGLCVVWQGSEFISSLVATPLPRQVSIRDIKERALGSAAFDYITVEGHLLPESELRLGGTSYIPLIEEHTRRAILVRESSKDSERLGPVLSGPALSSVTGRLQPIEPDRQIDVGRANLGPDVYLETAWSLAEGGHPAIAWNHGMFAGVIGGLFAVFTAALVKQGIIFEASPREMSYRAVSSSESSSEGELLDLRISACLALQPSSNGQNDNCAEHPVDRQHFLDIPGIIGSSKHGELVLMANVDASSRGGVAVAARKVGWWTSAIASKSIHNLETGLLHFGGQQRPALRFLYHQPTGEPMQAVLSFSTPQQQQHTYNHLLHAIRSDHTNSASRS
ncbi:MAG: hypothetical protein AAF268_11895 [Cyanobacteria bacterium P01_A01_bin.3]